MWKLQILIILTLHMLVASDDNDDPVLYYYGLNSIISLSRARNNKPKVNLYGEIYWTRPRSTCGCRALDEDELEESERSLSLCGTKQACSALLLRYWRAPALVRLCRCARRLRCDTRANPNRLVELNNRAYFQFCTPVDDWPECDIADTPLTVESVYDRMNPDELENLHHKRVQLTPPKINMSCRCRYPNYWRFNSSLTESKSTYKCGSLPLCKTGDFCGNVNYDLNALYQSCLCPRKHMCVHNGGITHYYMSEVLYRGKGWKAYCQPISDAYDYYNY